LSEATLVRDNHAQQEFDAVFEEIVSREELQRRLQVAERLGQAAIWTMSEHRQETELRSQLIEGFRRQFVTSYELDYVDGHVVDQDGRPMLSFIADDYRRAKQIARSDRAHGFYVGRSRADFDNGWAVDYELMQSEAPVGSTWIRVSPFPYDQDPRAVRERYYRSDTERCLIWLQRKTSDDTLELTSIAVDNKNFDQVQALFVDLGGSTEVDTAEVLPHHTLKHELSSEEFEHLVTELKLWAEIPHELDSLEQLDRLGGDVIEHMLDQYRQLEQATSHFDAPSSVMKLATDMLNYANHDSALENNGIDPRALRQATNGEVFGNEERAALQQVVVVAGHAALERILETGDDQSWRKQLEVNQLLGSSGRVFIEQNQEVFGCSGGLLQRMSAGRTLENWGKDTGPGTCKECKAHVEERGGCEVCVDCHIKLQTKTDLALAA